MGVSETMLSSQLSSINPKPTKYASVTVTEISAEYEDVSSDGIPPQGVTTEVKETPDTRSMSFQLSVEVEHIRVSFAILNVLEKFGKHMTRKAPSSTVVVDTELQLPAWSGKNKFLSNVYHHVRQGKPVQLTLPAFPCKSVC